MNSNKINNLEISDEIQTAMKSGRPIVALESTIISHGMPFPQNLETSNLIEKIIRKENAIPATIAILKGRIKIGLDQTELEQFAKSNNLIKVSRRDLPSVISQKQTGGTTVAATMICAKLAGISVFVTGGIGGVHRDSEKTMDVSADLTELANSNVAVVCAGIKSILDIPRSLEYLETLGVPVIGYQTKEFPAFYTSSSGYFVQSRMDKPEEIANCMKIKWDLGLKGGIIIGNPIKKEFSMDEKVIDEAISKALKEASYKNITGKGITPFLLERVNEFTNGESLNSNISLICNNARLGAKISIAFQAQS